MCIAARTCLPSAFSVGWRIELFQFFRIKTCRCYCFMKAGARPHTRIPEGPVYGFSIIGRK